MVFSSIYFLFIFLPVVLILYYAAPPKWKNIVLLAGSIYFYAWGEPVYIVLMLFSAVFNYVMGLDIARREEPFRRKRGLVFAIVINLLILGFFKYYGFVLDTINLIPGVQIPYRELALPIGISFYTFQALSYIIDVYRGKFPAQRNILHFSVYITMFPQLVAGPIVKYDLIRDQLAERTVTREDFGNGLERFVIGLGKKVLLANNLGLLYTAVQGMTDRPVLLAWVGIIAYTMQIYFDFSGYSDMAIGMGKMFGFRFPENFNYPYLAKSVTEFWRRWHMTLSFWFRDYVYIPLGGNRVKASRHIANILIVWLLTGLWHGAAWNFVFWGLYYGLLLIFEKYVMNRILDRLPSFVGHIYAMLLVILGWVLFSADSLGEAVRYFGTMIGIGSSGFAGGVTLYYLGTNAILLIVSALCCVPFFYRRYEMLTKRMPMLSAVVMLLLFVVCTAFLVYSSYNPFLYFRF